MQPSQSQHTMGEEEEEEPPHNDFTGDPTKTSLPDEKQQFHKEPGPPPPYSRPPHRGGRSPARGGGRGNQTRDSRRAICIFMAVLLILVAITALTLWLVYRPHHPRFRVVNAAVYQLNTSSPPFIAASMQFAVLARNPNKRVSIFYDDLSAYVAYKNQAITPPVILPPMYQDTRSTVALSPMLGGAPVLVAAELGNALAMDEAYGVVELRLVLTGKMRYKGGVIKSRRYGVCVTCDMLVSLKKGFVGNLPLLGSPLCRVYL